MHTKGIARLAHASSSSAAAAAAAVISIKSPRSTRWALSSLVRDGGSRYGLRLALLGNITTITTMAMSMSSIAFQGSASVSPSVCLVDFVDVADRLTWPCPLVLPSSSPFFFFFLVHLLSNCFVCVSLCFCLSLLLPPPPPKLPAPFLPSFPSSFLPFTEREREREAKGG